MNKIIFRISFALSLFLVILSSQSDAGQCEGTPVACIGIAGCSCAAQKGCFTDPRDTNRCMGTAVDCSQLYDSLSCNGQNGCTWKDQSRS